MALYNTDDEKERVILVSVEINANDDVESLLDELLELARTAGAEVVGRMIQPRDSFHPATYIGKGKLEELRLLIDELSATGIICDDELSPAQLRNLEDELQTKIMDRTMVILDIFAARATTSEGKIQVEMAQLKYRSTRLAGLGITLSRLGGGIGTRGPGEKKIESDRRLIRDRITKLNEELTELKLHRDIQRQSRSKTSTPVCAIVGYTNAGKSTLLNKLTDAGVLSENKLFATLDPTTRGLELPDGQKVLLTDTVGFIRKLPHNLIEAFKSTLEEAVYSDIIVHVVDCSNPDYERQMVTVYETLSNLGVADKPVVTLFNKCDCFEDTPCVKDLKADYTAYISAKTGMGLNSFLEILQTIIKNSRVRIETTFSYSEAGKIQLIREYGQLESEEYTSEGIKVTGYVPAEIAGKLGLKG
ncbi:MAG: GTPase HflX [Lachnospira sp.]